MIRAARRADPARPGGRAPAIALLVVGALAIASLLWAAFASSTHTHEEAVRAVAETLRCPSCAGESVADSTAPVAVAMREEAERQLAEGRSADEVRAWFAQRFGDEVLLDPPLRGAGLAVWAAPVLVLAGGAVMLVRGARSAERRRVGAMLGVAGLVLPAGVAISATGGAPSSPGSHDAVLADGGSPSSPDVLREAVARAPGDDGLRLALAVALMEEGRDAEAVEHLETAARLRPADTRTMFLLADARLRAGDAAAAGAGLDRLLEVDPEHGAALLLRGTMLWREQDERARVLLERFLTAHGDDPSAERVRAMLAEAGS